MTPFLASRESGDAQSPRRKAPRLTLQSAPAGASILPTDPIMALYVKLRPPRQSIR